MLQQFQVFELAPIRDRNDQPSRFVKCFNCHEPLSLFSTPHFCSVYLPVYRAVIHEVVFCIECKDLHILSLPFSVIPWSKLPIWSIRRKSSVPSAFPLVKQLSTL